MKKLPLYLLPAMLTLLLAAGCASGRRSSAGGEVTGVGGSAWAEPTPYGIPVEVYMFTSHTAWKSYEM
ncbi:MAG: hypothetical protein K2O33_02195, partial [Muribaculaceae bacterium]|nr:hypothetical protein [Muribaculaceae bacterium]